MQSHRKASAVEHSNRSDLHTRIRHKFAIHAFMTRLPRGRQARRLALHEMRQAGHFQWVLLRVVMICATLWAMFYVQFLLGIIYSLTYPPALTQSLRAYAEVAYFLPVDNSWTTMSLAWRFVFLSLIGVILAVVSAWGITRRVAARRRMRFATCLFACFPLGYAILNLTGESASWEHLEFRRAHHAEQLRLHGSDPWERDFHESFLDHYDSLLEQRQR